MFILCFVIYLSIYLSIYPGTFISIYLAIYLSILIFSYLSVYLSVLVTVFTTKASLFCFIGQHPIFYFKPRFDSLRHERSPLCAIQYSLYFRIFKDTCWVTFLCTCTYICIYMNTCEYHMPQYIRACPYINLSAINMFARIYTCR